MNILEIIENKKNNKILSREEINYVIDNYMNNEIKDYQMSSLLMSICINGMNDDETIDLVEAMLKDSKILDLSSINGICVDKHSTGGVGDKTSLIVVPIVAALGGYVMKLSGRSLGFTGGTIDKLESINNFNVNLKMDDIVEQVNNINACICYTSSEMVLADKKIYALRSESGTVDSIPLIASSIMSKKIAGGTNNIIIDLKVGNGALMKDLTSATELGKLMIKIGKKFDKKVICILSNMNEPLGNNIGNRLEVIEAINVLEGKGEESLTELCSVLASNMVSLSLNIDLEEASRRVNDVITTGKAVEKFKEIVKYQKGNLDNLEINAEIIEIISSNDGYITHIDSEKLGFISNELAKSDNSLTHTMDNNAGIIINKKINDYVNIGDVLCSVYLNKTYNNINKEVENCFKLENNKVEKEPLIFKILK